MAPNELSLVESARLVAQGALTSEALVRACLDRIALREEAVLAWAHLDGEQALREARQRDRSAPLGPLHGVPIAVKDVIDVRGMPTGMGSPIYKDYRPEADAACVAILRAAGAIVLGKTVTAEFAGVAAGPTRHPLAPDRTPGGSSSGSAAAVADRMVAMAFATQTAGSTLRPAHYCGLVGFKPSYNVINRAGLKMSAETLDTIGLIARDVEDATLSFRVLVDRDSAAPAPAADPPRLALFRTHHWSRASADTVFAVEGTAARLERAGALVREVPVPDGFDMLSEARRTINNYERARALAWEYHERRDELSPALAAMLAEGWAIPHDRYLDAIRLAHRWRGWMEETLRYHDAIITATADGEAPEGLSYTGSPAFQEIWTMLHAPAITLPVGTSVHGLPIGVQFVGSVFNDERLLAVGLWVQNVCK